MKLLWQQIPSPVITEIFCSSSFDGVVLDLEHGHFNNETLYSCIQVGSLLEKTVLVRVSHLDKQVIRMCLDAGISGIILSSVETLEEAKKFRDYCLYPSKENGGKRGQGLVRENLWGKKPLTQRKPLLIPQIETVHGVCNIKSISKLDFDYYLVGPYDLTASISFAGDFGSKDFKNAIDQLKKVVGYKLGFHIPSRIKEHYGNYKDYEFLALGMDTTFLIETLDNTYSLFS